MGGKTDNLKLKLKLPELVIRIVKAIQKEGGRSLLVGGYVRDLVLGKVSKDIDIEVHQLELDDLERILSQFGRVDLVGKQFGVLCLHGVAVDWSIPRRDSQGRHPEIKPDPWMGIEEAARRRDLTINSMAVEILEEKILDPFKGLEDLKNKRLRATDPNLFVEDPLRFFRVMGFAGRLEMEADPLLSKVCEEMDLSEIAHERIDEEFTKLFLRSKKPSIGLRWIESIGRLDEILPGTQGLVGLEQDPKWHPEGDVWGHTMQVMDAAAKLRTGDTHKDLMLMWAALCHDLGKPETTQMMDGRIRSLGHAEISAEKARVLLKKILTRKVVYNGALKLVERHHEPQSFFNNIAKPRAFKRLALRLAPETSMEHLAMLALADARGRNPQSEAPLDSMPEDVAWFLKQIEALKIVHQPEAPVLMGRHLKEHVKPGPKMGRMLERAYEIQLAENLKDVEILKQRVLEEYFEPD